MIDGMNERVSKQMKLSPDHPVMLDLKEMIQDVAELFVGESAKRERAKVLEEVREIVEEVQKEAEPMWSGDSVPFSHACSSILSRLDSLDKMG